MAERKDIYMNKVQQRIFYANARDLRVSAARRFGKTDGVIGPRMWQVSQSMPRSTNLFLGSSTKQLLTRTVPGVFSALKRFYNFQEGVHFGYGRPPKWVKDPVIKPEAYDRFMWFANGSIWYLASLAVFGSVNGMTVNSIMADECKFLPKSKIDSEVMPTLSGIINPNDPGFSEENPLYKSTCFVSDASMSARGNWLEKEEQRLDDRPMSGEFTDKTYREIMDLLDEYANDVIYWNEKLRSCKQTGHRMMVCEEPEIRAMYILLAQKILNREDQFKILSPVADKNLSMNTVKKLISYNLIQEDDAEFVYNWDYLITKEQHMRIMQIMESKRYAEYVRRLQCSAFYYVRASSLDNIDLLTADYIERMKRDLPPLVFAISILNMKQTKINDGFYSNLDIENVHGYLVDDCPALDGAMKLKTATNRATGDKMEYEGLDFESLGNQKDSSMDGDVVDSLPLHIAFDYNAHINWVCVGQVYKRDGADMVNVVNSLFVKNDQLLNALCKNFDDYYKPHKAHNRTLYYYYDSTAKFRAYAVENQPDFKDTIINCLRQMGWIVNPIDMQRPMLHKEKYIVLNQALAGLTYPGIRINRENNEALIIALENTGIKQDYKGFRKDKSGEKLSEESEDAVLLEYRTDGTDAFDSLYLGIKYFSNRLSGMCLPGRH